MKKILMLGNSHLTVFGFRGELIEQLVHDGYDVTVSFANGPFGEGEKSGKEYGCQFVETEINRRGRNPLQDLMLLRQYIGLIRRVRPDAVLTYTVKCDVYGGIACRLLDVPFLPNITGIGKGLAEGGLTGHILTMLYRIALRKASCVFFQNASDRRFFAEHGIRYERDVLLPGSGVNLKKFSPLPYPADGRFVFTYIARIMKAKGIEEFLEAARIIRAEEPKAEFHICGFCEEDYREKIAEAQAEGTVIYHGLVENVTAYYQQSHCVVLPSFHPEGVSNVLLEAAACARPIITTDRPGCREAVESGVSGFLVRERDSWDLADAMRCLLHLSQEERIAMGLAGRRKIEREFDRQIVVDAYLDAIRDI